jgi:uncharacterized membrane protein
MMEKPTKETLEKWHKDPNNWKWGSFYYNKEDHRLLPPKRISWMGWTVNFANPKSVALFVAILVFCLLSILYAESLK